MKQIEQVKKFRKAFKLAINDKPTLLKTKTYKMHLRLLREEVKEYSDACKAKDKVGIADGLVDIAYIVFGAVIEHGLSEKFEALFDEIQRSNMSKLDENGNPIYREDGKVLKGANYFKPDLKKILED